MGRKKDVDKLDIDEVKKKLSKEESEFLSLVKQGRHDPVFFAENLLDVRLHDGQKLWLWFTTGTQDEKACEIGIKIGRWKDRAEFQAALELLPSRQKNILVPSNRWGKTMVTSGVKHIWYLYYKIGVKGTPENISQTRCGTLNISPHSNQCQAGYDYILDILNSKFTYRLDGESYRNNCKIGDFFVSSNKQQRKIIFANDTNYRAVPTGEDQASSLAGTKYLYISYDECAQSLHLKEELPAKIMSRLIDYGGPMDLVSTPEVDKPSHQYFFHISKLGNECKDGWFTLVGKLGDNIFLSGDEIDAVLEAIRTTDPAKYRQVKFGEFVTTGKKMFDNLLVERLWDSYGGPEPVIHEHKYIVIADWGFADTGDPTVFYVIDYTNAINTEIPKHLRKYRIAYRESIQGGSPFAVLTRAKILQRDWNGAKFIHDSSSMGGVIIKKMLNEMNMGAIIDFSASGNKMDMLFVMIVVMGANRETKVDEENKVIDINPDFGRLRSYYIPALEEQLGNYQYNPDKGVTDKRLEQDEVMALGMGLWWLERKLLKNKVKSMNFNPLAADAKNILPEKEAEKIGMHTVVIPEKVIL